MRMRLTISKGAAAIALLAVGNLLLGPPRPTEAQRRPTKSAAVSVAFVTNNPSDYWTICRKGCEQATRELKDVHLQFVMPADGTASTQKADVEDLLAKGVKGIALSPVDPANETRDINTWAGRVPLLTSDSDAPQSNRICFIGTDNVAAGRMAGRLIRKALPRGGSIMLFVGKSDAQNARDRVHGIREALQGSRVHILGVQTDNTDHARARSNVTDALARYPHIAGMVGIWSYNGPAILNAVQNAGKAGKVKIVCFDEEQETVEGVKRGAIYATVAQQPYVFGYRSIKLLARLAHGDKSVIPSDKRMIVPTLAINRGNVSAYEAQQAKRLAEGGP